jgi:hypothetical protein
MMLILSKSLFHSCLELLMELMYSRSFYVAVNMQQDKEHPDGGLGIKEGVGTHLHRSTKSLHSCYIREAFCCHKHWHLGSEFCKKYDK